ncbi:hypothetical protein LPJ72_003793 [Coemansia sp. Benny D160-2]|nr:hypothetical protein LPJ72_003793 [Coemansia sp. Benny D160-2]
MKGALLVKNGEITTCQLALISNKAAFVAANCLDYKDGTNTPDDTTIYQVMISDGATKNIGRYTVDEVDAHPRYNPETFANNVALIKYNSDSSIEWKNYIAANPAEWDSELYVQRTLVSNSTSSDWNLPEAVQVTGDAPTGCVKASSLFKVNEVDFLCTTDTVADKSAKESSCVMPYGSVYGAIGNDLAVAALYSHSFLVGGDTLCTSTAVFSYYTLLSNYLEWGGVTAKSTVYLFASDASYVNNDKANYTMINPTGTGSVSGTLVGGDLYAIQAKASPSESSDEPSSSSSSESESVESTSESEPTSSPPEPTSSEKESGESASDASSTESSSSKSSGLISKILIIVGVVLLVIGIALFFFWRRHKKKKEARQRNEQLQANMYNDEDYNVGQQDIRYSNYDNPYDFSRAHLDTKINTY